MSGKLAAIILAAFVFAAPAHAQESVPEPDGYRTDDYRAPVPATLAGLRVLTTADAETIWRGGAAVFMFFLNGNRVHSVALSPPGEAIALRDMRLHDTVVVMGGGESLWQLIARQLRSRDPRRIAINSSPRAVADDGGRVSLDRRRARQPTDRGGATCEGIVRPSSSWS